MSITSPAPIYQPNSVSQTKVKLNNKALEALGPSFKRTSEHLIPNSAHSTPSYTLKKHSIQVEPNDFEKIRLLGKGDAGKVYLVKHKSTDKLYALKGKKK